MPISTDLRFDAGRVCLDLLATIGGSLSTDPVERLDSPERLVVWLRRAGVVPGDEPLELGSGALTEFLGLRGCLKRVVHSELAGEPAATRDIDRLNHVAQAGPPTSRLVQAADGTRYRRLSAPPRLEELLAAVAEDAIQLLSSPQRELLRECEGQSCDLVYLDASRGRRRRWCSAQACGNRHHVAAHRARKADLP
ncbi:ABATE domain-containing protein [Streptacidiphilus sp. P02-A3a]|uniref:CGNR zinc finger domain-containing protein n=1 Tax=Streptacidiphilus sp. P02-A3a TaxID=2704468 RepID=UPI0015FA393A|nr:ABATE domain-containing protein [Streptacidiphilus sp. P02-A3a]QMU68227.1 hypothetical protein GXP74_08295 [Streptacidiphilus sp. P02-A3a]